MWRFISNFSRGFKNHVHSLRPSAGLCVEEEQEVLERHEKVCPFSGRRRKSLDGDEVRHCSANILSSLCVNKRADGDNNNGDTTCHIGHNHGFNTGQEDGRRQKSSCHYDFWQMFSGSHRMLEALSWGSLLLFGADAEKHRYKSRLLFRVLLANHSNRTTVRSINSGISVSTATVLHQDIRSTKTATAQHQQDTAVKAICDTPGVTQGSAADSSLQTETLDSAMKEFEDMCTEYAAKTESLLGLEAAVHGDFGAAVPHLQSSCALGNTSACFNLGLCYETGSGVSQDLHQAKHYYSLAARAGHSMALYNLGLMCLQCSNYSTPQPAPAACACGCSPAQGLDLLEQAAQLGLAQAQTFLGIHHVEQTQDLTRAVPYFTAAAAQRDVDAQYFLAICYEQGWGVEVNECRAAQLYAEAAGGGHGVAIYNLAVYNEHGLGGLPQDKSSAIDLFQKAADLGCEQAKQRLEDIRSEQAKQRLEDIHSEQAKQRLGDTKTSETSFQGCSSKIEMFRQLYQHHHHDEHRPARHRHDSLRSPSASSPNLTEHIHQDIGFIFGSQTTDITHSKTYSRSQRDSRLASTSFHLGSDGEYDGDGGSSMDDSWDSITYDVFSSLRSLHKSQSQPNFSLPDLGVQV